MCYLREENEIPAFSIAEHKCQNLCVLVERFIFILSIVYVRQQRIHIEKVSPLNLKF